MRTDTGGCRCVRIDRTMIVVIVATFIVILAGLLGPARSRAAVPYADVVSSGPLEHVYLGADLSCQVRLVADVDLSFFPPSAIPGDCGTFIHFGGALYSPDFANHDGTATGSLPSPQPFTPISQSGIAGLGTAAGPYSVVTVADAGTTGVRITQRDSYAAGNRFYRTAITVSNAGPGAQTVSLYHAGDCYLANTDIGYGFLDASTGGTFCSANPNNSPQARIIGFDPADADSAGATYVETFFDTVWSMINGQPFPNSCDCNVNQDNGAGLQWSFSVPPGGEVTRSLLTTIDPTGRATPVEACGFPITGVNQQGGAEADVMTGTPLSDQLRGGAGKDLITGDADRDCLSGQSEPDKIRGNAGNDVIRGGGGNDLLVGGSGGDVMIAQNGDDKVKGGAGADRVKAQGRGSDKVNCGAGKDSAVGDVKDKISRNCEKVRIVDRH